MTVFWISLCFDNCLVICTVTLCYVLHQTYSELWHIQHWYFLGICWHIQLYLAVLKHNHAPWDINKAYSGLFRHIEHPVEPSHIHNLAIFWALAYLELEAYLKHCETLTKHIQNPAIGHYSDIFRDIQNLVQRLRTQKPGLLGILEYLEPFHNCIPRHIQNPVILMKI